LLHVGVCCKLLFSQVLIKGSKEIKVTVPHIANRTCDWLGHYGWEVMDHPPYSFDVIPSDVHLLGPLVKLLAAGSLQCTLT
jgi:hypothetical protein